MPSAGIHRADSLLGAADRLVQLDDDTVLSAGSFEASLRTAGGAILAVDEVMAGKAKNAFVAIRLAGHHAEASTAMGFCLFNNAAIAVRHAQQRYGAERTAIVDFDAHHGNARNKSSGVIKG